MIGFGLPVGMYWEVLPVLVGRVFGSSDGFLLRDDQPGSAGRISLGFVRVFGSIWGAKKWPRDVVAPGAVSRYLTGGIDRD